MPYKDPEAQRAAQRRSYERNKLAILAKQAARRATEEGKAERKGERRRRAERIAIAKQVPTPTDG